MPPLTRWYIKVALLYLVGGLLLGALHAAQAPLGLPSFFAAAGPALLYFEYRRARHKLGIAWFRLKD